MAAGAPSGSGPAFGLYIYLRDGFTAVSKKVSASMTRLEKSSGKLTDSVRHNMHNMYAGFGNIFAAYQALIPIGMGVRAAAEFETAEASMLTFLKSAELARATVEKIKTEAIETPFGFSELLKTNTMLVSAGKSAEDARDITHGLAVALVAAGRGNAELSRMAINMQQIANFGKASGRDVREFANAGINIFQLMADSLGITIEQAQKIKPTYEMIKKALVDGAKAGGFYAGAMERYMSTVAGKLEIVKDKWTFGLAQMGDSMKGLTKVVLDAVDSMLDKLYKLGETASGRAKLQLVALTVIATSATLAFIGLRVILAAVRTQLIMAVRAAPLMTSVMVALGMAFYGVYKHAGSLENTFLVLKGVFEMFKSYNDGSFKLSHTTGIALAEKGLLKYSISLMKTLKKIEAFLKGVIDTIYRAVSFVANVMEAVLSGINYVIGIFTGSTDNMTTALDRARLAGQLFGYVILYSVVARVRMATMALTALRVAVLLLGWAFGVAGAKFAVLRIVVGVLLRIRKAFALVAAAAKYAGSFMSRVVAGRWVLPLIRGLGLLVRAVSAVIAALMILKGLYEFFGWTEEDKKTINKFEEGARVNKKTHAYDYGHLRNKQSDMTAVRAIPKYARPSIDTKFASMEAKYVKQESELAAKLRASGTPIQVNTTVELDGRKVGESVKQYIHKDNQRLDISR